MSEGELHPPYRDMSFAVRIETAWRAQKTLSAADERRSTPIKLRKFFLIGVDLHY
jgi:hypothetical protein